MELETLQIALIIAGISLGFYVQTVAGFGSALLALPVLLTTLGLQEAVALISVFFFLFSCYQVFKNRKLADRDTVIKLIVGIALGLVAGILLLKYGRPLILKKGLGVFILIYVGYLLLKQKKIAWFDKFGLFFGFGSGFFSGLFSTGGPLCVVYVYNKMFNADVFRATVIVVLGLTDFIKLPLLIFSGILTPSVLLTALYVLPFFLLAIFLGQKTYKRINEDVFRKILMVLLVLSGVFLIIR